MGLNLKWMVVIIILVIEVLEDSDEEIFFCLVEFWVLYLVIYFVWK